MEVNITSMIRVRHYFMNIDYLSHLYASLQNVHIPFKTFRFELYALI